MTHKSIKRGSPHTVGHFIHLYIDGTLVVLLSAFGACWLAHSCMKQKEMYHLMQNQFVCSNSEHFLVPFQRPFVFSFFSLFSFFPDCLPCSLHHSNCYVHMTDLIIGVMYFGLPPPKKKKYSSYKLRGNKHGKYHLFFVYEKNLFCFSVWGVMNCHSTLYGNYTYSKSPFNCKYLSTKLLYFLEFVDK